MEKKTTGNLRFIDTASTIILLALINHGNSIESPDYSVVLHLEPDTEIRLYKESLWVAAMIKNSTSFEKTTKDGFHRLYEYVHGANLNSSQIMITAPVLTTFVPEKPTSDSYVKLYLPAKYQAAPPFPATELNLQFERWKAKCLAIRKFSGFAKDNCVNKEINALVAILNKTLSGKAQILDDKSSFFTIAQYNAPFHLSGRLNEVWINVSAFAFEGCPSF